MQGPSQTEVGEYKTEGSVTEGKPCHYILVSIVSGSTSAPVLFFPYPHSTQVERSCPSGYEVREMPPNSTNMRIAYSFTKRYMYNAMRQVFKSANIKKLTKANTTNWNIFWGQHLKPAEYTALMPYQKVNHFPGSFELGRKDRLCGNLLRLRKKHPEAYRDIIPETYLTANEYDRQQFFAKYCGDPQVLWILKPPNLSCGRGIKVIAATTTPSPKVTKKKAYVAQRYIANPFLINELKFDLRIYVLVTSYDPLRVYLYDDGLVRFCTEKYSTSKAGLKNHFGHLTNYSVNKKNTAAFQPNDDNQDDEDSFNSSKWSLKNFIKYICDQGKGKQLESFHVALEDLIVKTFIAVESKILMMTTNSSGTSNGFELYGFDILLEGDEMKPWLLEVNVFPSLGSSSPMDKRIKTILVSDMFQLVGIPYQDAGVAMEQAETEKQNRLLGMNWKKPSAVERKRTVDDLMKTKSVTMDLDEGDLRLLKEFEEEDHRRGNFKRIFPTSESWEKYGELFETPRYKNVLAMRWLHSLAIDPRRRSSAAKK